MHLPVKRVETETVITHEAIGRGQRQNQNKLKDGQKMGKSTCAIVRSVVNITGSFQCRLCTHTSPVTGTGRSDTCVDMRRGQVQNFDLNGRSDAGHILQPQKTGISWTAFPRTGINTKKSLRTISRLKTLSKHGGFLLSHLVWQYHRR